MRKLFSLLVALSAFSYTTKAAFAPVTHTSGAAVIGTTTVTVAPVGSVATIPVFSACLPGPYFIAPAAAGGYQYSFAPAKVTHIRMNITDFQNDDTIEIKVNGVSFNLLGSTIVDYAGCPDPFNASLAPGGFKLACNAATGTKTDATLTFGSSDFIQTLEVIHGHTNPASGGVVYSFEFNIDSCNQPFKATADSPACKGRDLHLFATTFPNTTYSWTNSVPNFASTQQNPVHLAVPYSSTPVTYTVTATRGACVYVANKTVNIDNTPGLPIMGYKGPKCQGDKDSVTIKSNIPGGGYYVFIKPDGTTQIPATAPFDFIELPNIQPANAGLYRGVAVLTSGCASDTASVVVALSPGVDADFTASNKLGCSSDSVEFIDASTGNNVWKWSFGDGQTSTEQNPINVYSSQGTYNVKLWVSNGTCVDSIIKPISLNHPLTADFDISADSICQGGTIVFTNNSIAAPATIPTYFWDFKDGATDENFNVSHLYTKYGVYDVTMTITDYLGCKKTATKTIVVDSLGSASFFSDTLLCAGENIKFLGDYSEIGGTYALWDFNDGHLIKDKFTIEHAYLNPGDYQVQLTAHYRICPDTTYKQNIKVLPFPSIDLGPDTSLCPNGESFVIKDLVNAAGSPGIKWRWNTITKDTTTSIVVHHPGVYAVTVDQDGCVATDTIEVKKNCYIDIPNVFTPNGDGYNDYFLPRQLLSKSVTKFSMNIYNRWGDIVYQTERTDGRGWDGKLNNKEMPNGVYVYIIKATFANGTNENYQGNVTLLR